MSEADPSRRSDPTRRRIVLAVGAAVLASFAFACAGIIGIEDRLPDDVIDEAGTGFDRAVPDDAGTPPGVCPGTATCVVVPEGWTLASLTTGGRPGCTEGYGAPEDVVVATDGLGCSCKCTETAPGSCAAAGATTTFRDYPAAGCSASTATYTLSILDGGCANAAIPTTPAVRVPTPPSSPPSCAADAGPTPLKNGQVCAAQGGASCTSDGGICAGALADPQRLCLERDGDVACPAGFEKKFFLGSNATNDTRRCGTCTCTPGTQCDSPVLDLFTGAGCTKSTARVQANGSCTPTDAGVTYASYRYSGKAPGCQPSVPPLLDGGVTIETPRTLCCEQRN